MKKFLAILLFLSLFSHLYSQKNLPNVNFIYSSARILRPSYKLFLQNGDSAILYIKLNLKEINFAQLANHQYKAELKIKYLFYHSLEDTHFSDSASRIISIKQKNINKVIATYMKIPKPDSNTYIVIITEDLYNKNKVLNFVKTDFSKSSSQYFLLKDSATYMPIFSNYVKLGKKYIIETSLNIDSLTVHRYMLDTAMPVPPFSSLRKDFYLVEDTSYRIDVNSYFEFNHSGIYNFIADNGYQFSVVCFDNYYPLILKANQMLPPLKYLTTKEEYKELANYPNKKLAVDDFWLSVDSNYSNARNLIQIYYNRVELANYFFTENKQGWMTDRGMIFVIYGTPSVIYKGDSYEQWIYYSPFSKDKLVFNFYKIKTNYGIVKFVLKRNQAYLTYWKNAINLWKKGNFSVF